MADMAPALEPLAAEADFGDTRIGEAPPWLRYLLAL